jgi:hypothetical protein
MPIFVTVAQFMPLSFGDAVQLLLMCALAIGFLMLFKPLLRGLALAAVLFVRPKRTKAQRLARRQLRDAALASRA